VRRFSMMRRWTDSIWTTWGTQSMASTRRRPRPGASHGRRLASRWRERRRASPVACQIAIRLPWSLARLAGWPRSCIRPPASHSRPAASSSRTGLSSSARRRGPLAHAEPVNPTEKTVQNSIIRLTSGQSRSNQCPRCSVRWLIDTVLIVLPESALRLAHYEKFHPVIHQSPGIHWRVLWWASAVCARIFSTHALRGTGLPRARAIAVRLQGHGQ